MKVFLGISSYNRKDLLYRCLESLKPSRHLIDTLVVVDNGNQGIESSGVSIQISNKNNLGYCGGTNQILQLAKDHEADWCLILNDDITVVPDFMKNLIPILELCNDKWLLTPDWEWACIAFSKAGIKNLEFTPRQWLDEQFWPGYYSDNDLHWRLKASNNSDKHVPGVPELEPWIKDKSKTKELDPSLSHHAALPIYIKKWGGEVGQEIFTTPYNSDKSTMEKIQQIYQNYCKTPSDIFEHMPTLKRYGEACKHITEMGTRSAVSTYAFLSANPSKFVTYDLIKHENVRQVEALADEYGIPFEFKKENTRDCVIEETDLLFIDTWHTYDQLKVELNRHHKNVRKYIIMHDTISFGNSNESAYSDYTNLTLTKQGLRPAIREFLETHKDWRMKEEFTNNNGLMVLERVNIDANQ